MDSDNNYSFNPLIRLKFLSLVNDLGNINFLKTTIISDHLLFKISNRINFFNSNFFKFPLKLNFYRSFFSNFDRISHLNIISHLTIDQVAIIYGVGIDSHLLCPLKSIKFSKN